MRATGFQTNLHKGVVGLLSELRGLRVEAIEDDGTLPDDEVSLMSFDEALKLPDKTDIEFVAYEQCSYKSIWLHCTKKYTKIKKIFKHKNKIPNQSKKKCLTNNL